MKPLTAREAIGLFLIVALGFWFWRGAERRAGALQEKLAQNAEHIAALDSALKVERAKFRTDTVKLFRRITNTDTLLAEIVKSDTLRLTDTVKVTVEVVKEAVATLNACRAVVLSCGELRAMEQGRADSLAVRVKLLEKSRPSTFGNAIRVAGIVGLTVAAMKVLR